MQIAVFLPFHRTKYNAPLSNQIARSAYLGTVTFAALGNCR